MENKKERSGMAGGHESYSVRHTNHRAPHCQGTHGSAQAGLQGGFHGAIPALQLDLGACSAFLVSLAQTYLQTELIQSEDHQAAPHPVQYPAVWMLSEHRGFPQALQIKFFPELQS